MPNAMVPPTPRPTAAPATFVAPPIRRVLSGVSARRTATIRTQKNTIPATSANALITWRASIQLSKLTRSGRRQAGIRRPLPENVADRGQEVRLALVEEPKLELQDATRGPVGQTPSDPRREVAVSVDRLDWMRNTAPLVPRQGSSLTLAFARGSGRSRNPGVRVFVISHTTT